MGFKRQYQLAEKLKSFFPDETSRKSVKILDIAAGTGLVGVGLKKEGSWDQKNILKFVKLRFFVYLQNSNEFFIMNLEISWPIKN